LMTWKLLQVKIEYQLSEDSNSSNSWSRGSNQTSRPFEPTLVGFFQTFIFVRLNKLQFP
jgi:hypothetical protein